jgi:hypothetical protein
LISGYGISFASPAKLPSDFSTCAAWLNPAQAASAIAGPTLMRRTPSAAMSPTTQANIPGDQKIDGFRPYCFDERAYLRRIVGTRREKYVCTRVGIRLQASGRLAKRIGMANEVALRSGGEQDVGTGPIKCLTCSANAFNCER